MTRQEFVLLYLTKLIDHHSHKCFNNSDDTSKCMHTHICHRYIESFNDEIMNTYYEMGIILPNNCNCYNNYSSIIILVIRKSLLIQLLF